MVNRDALIILSQEGPVVTWTYEPNRKNEAWLKLINYARRWKPVKRKE